MIKNLKSIKVKTEFKPRVDNLVFKLHYRATNIVFMVAVILTTIYDVVGDKIKCLTSSSIQNFGKVVNSYCLIQGTFTVQKHHNTTVGAQAAYPGVGPSAEDDDIITHSYYQWVPFFLFGLGVLFYIPHWLWKILEGGLFTNIIQDLSLKDYLSKNMSSFKNRGDRFKKLAQYLISHMHKHQLWAFNFFACELLNLVVDIFVIFFINWFLGGEFTHYGSKVFDMIGQDPETRVDELSYVFPKIAKCTFRMFGSSGTIEIRDIMCLIATNIMNEKVFVFVWVWLRIVIIVTTLWLLFRVATMISPGLRRILLKSTAPQAGPEEVNTVMKHVSISDWLLLIHLGKNIEPVVFSEFISQFASQLNVSSPYIEDESPPSPNTYPLLDNVDYTGTNGHVLAPDYNNLNGSSEPV